MGPLNLSSRHSETAIQLHDANYILYLFVPFQVERYSENLILRIAHKLCLTDVSVIINEYDGGKTVHD